MGEICSQIYAIYRSKIQIKPRLHDTHYTAHTAQFYRVQTESSLVRLVTAHLSLFSMSTTSGFGIFFSTMFGRHIPCCIAHGHCMVPHYSTGMSNSINPPDSSPPGPIANFDQKINSDLFSDWWLSLRIKQMDPDYCAGIQSIRDYLPLTVVIVPDLPSTPCSSPRLSVLDIPRPDKG